MATDALPVFADLLRRARRVAALTQEQLAEQAGLSARVISDLERGVIRAPRRDTLDLLADALKLSAQERQQWEQTRRRLATRSVATSTTSTPVSTTNLPTPLTSFVGREQEIKDVIGLLRRGGMRLLTLLGPGGVGKTRLALAVAHALQQNYADGVWFVNLAPLSDLNIVVPTIAATLGVQETGGQPLTETLTDRLRDTHMLLVLDNLEQVVAAAPTVGQLLVGCPRLTILATSRVPLHVTGEQEYAVSPLGLPDHHDLHDVTRLLGHAAIALFVQRAQLVRPDFAVTSETAHSIAQICLRLDGLPLAIELAAARMRTFSPQALRQRLDQRLPLLVGGARDLPARQQTLRDTIAWSYDLLTPDEQRVFRRLSVCRGGWTVDAAEVVVGDDLAIDELLGLERLVAHNLVRVREQDDGEPRFSMLETMREFGLEQLRTCGEEDATRFRHAQYVVRLAEGVQHDYQSEQRTRAWFDGFQRDLDNVREVLQWAAEHDRVELGLHIAGAASSFWYRYGYWTEGRGWLEPLLRRSDAVSAHTRMHALLGAGGLAAAQGDVAVAVARLHACLRIADDLGSDFTRVLALSGLGHAYAVADDPDAARIRGYYEDAVAVSRALGHTGGVLVNLGNLALILRDEGHLVQAESCLQEALHIAREQHAEHYLVELLSQLGQLARDRGDLATAQAYIREALSVPLTSRAFLDIIGLLDLHAQVSVEGGKVARAVSLFAALGALREQVGVRLSGTERAGYDAALAAARSRLDAAEYAAAWHAGSSMSLDEAIDVALDTASSSS